MMVRTGARKKRKCAENDATDSRTAVQCLIKDARPSENGHVMSRSPHTITCMRDAFSMEMRNESGRGVTRNLLQGGPSQVLGGGPVGKLEI